MAVSMSIATPAIALRNFMHRIDVPPDLASITDMDSVREVDPREVGMSAKQALRIWTGVENLYRSGYYPAVMFCLRRQGKIVFNRALGHARGNGPHSSTTRKIAARISTPSCIFSASKAITAMVLHRMEELNLLNLLNPISHYIPEFARHGKERITIYHLLSHRAGVPGIAGVSDPTVILDHARSLELLCDAQPLHVLGRKQAYHAITGGVLLDEIVKRVAGMDMRAAWRKWFKEPMGLKVLDYGATPAIRTRMTEQVLTGIQGCALVDRIASNTLGATLDEVLELVANPRFSQVVIPSGNMVSTAEEASAFYQMLLDGGRWNGRQILRRDTIQRATMEVGPHVIDATIGLPLRFSQGFMLGGTPFGLFGRRSHHAYGHLGLVNNMTWADPERQISVALLVSGIPLLAGNLAPLVRLIGRIAGECSRVPV